jgi:hypothetical protein
MSPRRSQRFRAVPLPTWSVNRAGKRGGRTCNLSQIPARGRSQAVDHRHRMRSRNCRRRAAVSVSTFVSELEPSSPPECPQSRSASSCRWRDSKTASPGWRSPCPGSPASQLGLPRRLHILEIAHDLGHRRAHVKASSAGRRSETQSYCAHRTLRVDFEQPENHPPKAKWEKTHEIAQ